MSGGSNTILRWFHRHPICFAIGMVLSISLLTIVGVGQLRWRAHVLLLHITGQIPDIDLKQIVAYMMPGSQQSMAFLVERRNPYAVVRNFRTEPADIEAGR